MENGEQKPSWYSSRKTFPTAFKLRKTYGNRTGWTGQANAVIVLTDKPQKPLPLDWSNLEAVANVAAELVEV